MDYIATSKYTLWLLFVFSFLETIIVPIPIELILVPLMVKNRSRIWTFAIVTLAGCLVASLVGYGVGFTLYETIGTWFINAMGFESSYETYQSFFDSYGFWAILAVGIIPIPFQIAMITAGIAGYPILLFLLAAFISRGLRYFGLALLVDKFGERAQMLWKTHATKFSIITGIVLIVVFLLVQQLGEVILK